MRITKKKKKMLLKMKSSRLDLGSLSCLSDTSKQMKLYERPNFSGPGEVGPAGSQLIYQKPWLPRWPLRNHMPFFTSS